MVGSLSKTYIAGDHESLIYSLWESQGLFKEAQDPIVDPFVLVMPPPNVTGFLHMGHALSYTLQDVLVRYYRLRGRSIIFQPGTDHAGIAAQMVVERDFLSSSENRLQLGRQKFIEKMWDWKKQSGGEIVKQLKSLGISALWDRERFTMDEGLSEAVRYLFVQLYHEGLIYKDKRLVNWDPKLQTAISDLEVEQKDVSGFMYYLDYAVEGLPSVKVGTTRPETIFADAAIAVHPKDERYKDYIGRQARIPLIDREIPIICDEYADPQKGTGAVKITPAHDFNDFEVGIRHDLPRINLLSKEGTLNENVPLEYQNLTCEQARIKILLHLQESGSLAYKEEKIISVPHGDRSGAVIEPFLTDQWYVDAKQLAPPCIKAVQEGEVKFYPKSWENTFFSWFKELQPWCISRQLWWGHRIPAWYGPDGKIFVAKTDEEVKEQARSFYKKDVPLIQDEDVLDTWFSSGLWPMGTLNWPQRMDEIQKYYPTSVLVTGFDIIFFWVARMMMFGYYTQGKPPFHDVYVHALLRDSKGQKMSKSKGNVIDPLQMSQKYGTDSLRLTLTALVAQGRDLCMSEDRIVGYRNFITKLWNAARFCEMQQCCFVDDFRFEAVDSSLNCWILVKLRHVEKSVEESIEKYRFHDYAAEIYDFVWRIFCDSYLEWVKPIFYGQNGALQRETRQIMGYVLKKILQYLHPMIPYVTEVLWGHLLGKGTVALSKIQEREVPENFYEYAQCVDFMIDFISHIRSIRASVRVPPRAKIKCIMAKDLEGYAEYEIYVKFLASLETIEFSNEQPQGYLQASFQGYSFYLDVAAVIHIKDEKKRLADAYIKLSKEKEILEERLKNREFIQRAPEDVVDLQSKRLLVILQDLINVQNAQHSLKSLE